MPYDEKKSKLNEFHMENVDWDLVTSRPSASPTHFDAIAAAINGTM